MAIVEKLITDNLDIWSSAIKAKSAAGSGRGRSKGKKLDLYGIKKLRELILELAVRGLLVPQDPNDEPASELLKKIATEKDKLVKDGIIKKKKAMPPIGENEIPFKLPMGWEWARLNEIGHDWGQKTPENEFMYIDVGSINKELGFVSEPSILASNDAPSRARKIVKKGTVIYSTVRPYLLNIAVINEEFDPEPIASTAFAIIHPFDGILASFIYRYLRSPVFINYVESCQTGIAYPAVNDKQFFSGLFPVAPLPEQHRIVAKVDELMAVCNQLELQTETSISAHQTLVQNLIEVLTNTSEHDGFTQAWARIAEHFDTLFTTEWSIDQLKQTILQLAVMGKLVPQNPNDEPASELLKKIAAEKGKLIKDGKIKKQKSLLPIDEDEKPFELPYGWEWVRLNDIYDVRDGTHDTPKYYENGYPLVTSKNLSSGKLDISNVKLISEEDHIKITARSKVDKEDILFAMIGSIGNPVLVDIEPNFSIKNVALFKYYSRELSCPNFLLRFLFFAEIKMKAEATGAVQSFVSLGKVRSFVMSLPPLAEQHRIVAKTNELMALCDTLKAHVNTAHITQLHLADAMAKQALN